MKRILSLAFTTVVTVSLVLFYACSPLKKYKTSVQQWEGDIRKFEQLDSTSYYRHDAILFMGSSSIRLWNTLPDDMRPYYVIQRGFGGSKLSDVAWYTPRIVYPHEVQAVVIYVGNDITGSDQDKTPQEVAGLFRYIVKTIRKKMPETPIFYIEITPTESRWKVWNKIQEGNSLVKQQCAMLHNVYFIEAADNFLNQEGKPNAFLFQKDKLHLNAEGYRIWSGIIKKNLDNVLKK